MSGAMTRGQIAKNGVRFPNRRITLLNDGYTAMGFIARNADVSSPNLPPASICWCSSPSSPISHITFWTLNELRRPQTFSIFTLDRVSKFASIGS